MMLSDDAEAKLIRRPDEPEHFMRMKPAGKRVCVTLGDTLLADSTDAFRVMEVGRDLYDPVLYLPRDDVKVNLSRTEKATHCPLKGDASYYNAALPGSRSEREVAWSYTDPLDHAEALRGLVAFDPTRVTIIERPN